jgi:hypothetical protein
MLHGITTVQSSGYLIWRLVGLKTEGAAKTGQAAILFIVDKTRFSRLQSALSVLFLSETLLPLSGTISAPDG